MADKEAGANCPAALVHAARTRSRLGGKAKQRFQEGAVDEVRRDCHVSLRSSAAPEHPNRRLARCSIAPSKASGIRNMHRKLWPPVMLSQQPAEFLGK